MCLFESCDVFPSCSMRPRNVEDCAGFAFFLLICKARQPIALLLSESFSVNVAEIVCACVLFQIGP